MPAIVIPSAYTFSIYSATVVAVNRFYRKVFADGNRTRFMSTNPKAELEEWVQRKGKRKRGEEEGTASCSVAYCPASSLFKLSAVGILMCKSTQSHVRGTSDPLPTLYRPPSSAYVNWVNVARYVNTYYRSWQTIAGHENKFSISWENNNDNKWKRTRAIWSSSWFRCCSTNALSPAPFVPVPMLHLLIASISCAVLVRCYWTI